MPAPSVRPKPQARMVELLAAAKLELRAAGANITVEDFNAAWAAAWSQMIAERAYPHATEHRRQWRVALMTTKWELRAAFIDRPTAFSSLAEALLAASERLRCEVTADDLPTVILGAIQAGYPLTHTDERELIELQSSGAKSEGAVL